MEAPPTWASGSPSPETRAPEVREEVEARARASGKTRAGDVCVASARAEGDAARRVRAGQ